MAIWKKKRNYFTLEPQGAPAVPPVQKPTIPEGLWHKCRVCEKIILQEELKKNWGICPKCGAYSRLCAKDRLGSVTDETTFREINGNIVGTNPLDFPQYDEKIHAVQQSTGIKEGVITGYGRVGGVKVALAAMEPGFIMGSMGSAIGEKLASLVEFADFYHLPLIIFSASGGARMQEGIVSLMQMAKVSAALKRFSDNGNLYISVPTDPTTGGVTASFAMLGDIILAEPGTLIGFAGRRVIEGTINTKLPEDFQTAEFLLKHGFLDAVVRREEMKSTLNRLLRLHGYSS